MCEAFGFETLHCGNLYPVLSRLILGFIIVCGDINCMFIIRAAPGLKMLHNFVPKKVFSSVIKISIFIGKYCIKLFQI